VSHDEEFLWRFWRNRARELTEKNAVIQTELAKAREALEESQQALNDWVVTYASDMCDEKTVQEARERIVAAGGTLAYIANITERNRAALQQKEREA
jgi:hypothetical protein